MTSRASDLETASQPGGDARPYVHAAASRWDTRIDAPHPLQTESALQARANQPTVGADDVSGRGVSERPMDWPDLVEQLHLQARQIQAHLDQQRQSLDRREARLSAHAAEVENQARALRLWLVERQAEIDERAAALARRESTVAERESRIAAAEVFQEEALREARSRVEARRAELDRREAQLDVQRQRLQRETAALEQAQRDLQQRRTRQENFERYSLQRISAEREASLEIVRRLLAAQERRRAALERLADQTAVPASSSGQRAPRTDRNFLARDRGKLQELRWRIGVVYRRLTRARSETARQTQRRRLLALRRAAEQAGYRLHPPAA